MDRDETFNLLNYRPIPPDAYCVLFVGDSLTCHGPLAGVWDRYNGMAATGMDRDYIHLFAARLQQALGNRPVEIFIYSMGSIKDIFKALEQGVSPCTMDLVVYQGGENDPFDESFPITYRKLITSHIHAAQTKPTHAIVLGDWYNREKADFDRGAAQEAGLPFIDLYALYEDKRYSGDGGPYNHPGVASHPNDAGMQAIADALWATYRDAVLPTVK